jgi:hypothetical protein
MSEPLTSEEIAELRRLHGRVSALPCAGLDYDDNLFHRSVYAALPRLLDLASRSSPAREPPVCRECGDALPSQVKCIECGTYSPLPPLSPPPAREPEGASKALVLLDGLDSQIARRETALANKGKGGMHVPEGGDFVNAPPSVLLRLKWWTREIRRALAGETREAPGTGIHAGCAPGDACAECEAEPPSSPPPSGGAPKTCACGDSSAQGGHNFAGGPCVNQILRAPAPALSETPATPGPSVECHAEGCGWRWPKGDPRGCPTHGLGAPAAPSGAGDAARDQLQREWDAKECSCPRCRERRALTPSPRRPGGETP